MGTSNSKSSSIHTSQYNQVFCLNCSCTHRGDHLRPQEQPKELNFSSLERSKPNFNQLSEKKLVKLTEDLLQKEDKEKIKHEELVQFLSPQKRSYEVPEDLAYAFARESQAKQEQMLNSSDLEWAFDFDGLSSNQSILLRPHSDLQSQHSAIINSTQQLQKRLLKKHFGLLKSRQLKQKLKTINKYKQGKAPLRDQSDLKRIKRKQVLCQLAGAGEKKEVCQFTSTNKTMIQLNRGMTTTSKVLGEALKGLTPETTEGAKEESISKQYVFN